MKLVKLLVNYEKIIVSSQLQRRFGTLRYGIKIKNKLLTPTFT